MMLQVFGNDLKQRLFGSWEPGDILANKDLPEPLMLSVRYPENDGIAAVSLLRGMDEGELERDADRI